MNRILLLTMLLSIIFGNNTLFAQTKSEKLFNTAKYPLVINSVQDTLTTNTAKDTLVPKISKESPAIKTTLYRFVANYDSVHNNSKDAYNKDAFKFKNDAFQEKMNELKLSELLINVFFK